MAALATDRAGLSWKSAALAALSAGRPAEYLLAMLPEIRLNACALTDRAIGIDDLVSYAAVRVLESFDRARQHEQPLLYSLRAAGGAMRDARRAWQLEHASTDGLEHVQLRPAFIPPAGMPLRCQPVVRLIRRGVPPAAVAEQLGISIDTVHRRLAEAKLQRICATCGRDITNKALTASWCSVRCRRRFPKLLEKLPPQMPELLELLAAGLSKRQAAAELQINWRTAYEWLDRLPRVGDRSCIQCGEPLGQQQSSARYCSSKCKERARRQRQRCEQPVGRRCKRCGTSIDHKRRTAKTCSKACQMALLRAKQKAAALDGRPI